MPKRALYSCTFELWSTQMVEMDERAAAMKFHRLRGSGTDTATNFGVMALLPSEDGASTWLTIL